MSTRPALILLPVATARVVAKRVIALPFLGDALSARLARWTTLLTRVFILQCTIQFIALVNGIIVVRTLAPREYAYFTMASTVVGAMIVLSDAGVSSGLSKIGGTVWRDRARFGQLLTGVRQVRRSLGILSALVAAPVLVVLLWSNGSPFPSMALLVSLAVACFALQAAADINQGALRLAGLVGRSQSAEVVFHASRLLLLGAGSLVGLGAAALLGIQTLCQGLRWRLVTRWLGPVAEPGASPCPEDIADMKSLARRLLPGAVFYCLQGQITVWLAAAIGGTQTVAEVGALGRLGVFFGVVQGALMNSLIPHLARCQSKNQLSRAYLRTIGLTALSGVPLLILCTLLPKPMLWILGEHYAHLENCLALAVTSAITHLIVSTMWSMNAARGWVDLAWLNIPGTILTQILLVLWLDVSTTQGVLLFGLLSSVPMFLLNTLIALRGLRSFGV